jgi:hypothetical protein
MNIFRPNVTAAAGYIPGEQPTDSVTIKLNTNENPYPPSPKVMEAIRGVTAEQLRKYPSPSGQAFGVAAGKVHGVGADWILPFNGGDELLNVAIRAAAGESDAVRGKGRGEREESGLEVAWRDRENGCEDIAGGESECAERALGSAGADAGDCGGVWGVGAD